MEPQAWARGEPSALRRLAATLIDGTVLLLLLALVVLVAWLAASRAAVAWVWLALAYLYLTVMKRSIGTLGYLATGVRIVSLEGKRPGMVSLTLRLVWWGFGPLNFLIDLLHVTCDEDRQALRDKMLRTYVVRKGAQPAGHGPLRALHVSFMGCSLTGFQVARPASPSEPRSDVAAAA